MCAVEQISLITLIDLIWRREEENKNAWYAHLKYAPRTSSILFIEFWNSRAQ